MEWFKLAAAKGNADAQTKIGVMYIRGDGVAKDFAEGLTWFKLAAAQGHASAQAFLDQLEKASNETRGGAA